MTRGFDSSPYDNIHGCLSGRLSVLVWSTGPYAVHTEYTEPEELVGWLDHHGQLDGRTAQAIHKDAQLHQQTDKIWNKIKTKINQMQTEIGTDAAATGSATSAAGPGFTIAFTVASRGAAAEAAVPVAAASVSISF